MLRSRVGIARLRASVVLALALSATSLLVPGDAGGVTEARAAVAAPFDAGHPVAHFLAYYHSDRGAGAAAAVSEARRRPLVVLNAWEYGYIPQIKAANPSAVVLVYKDLSSARDHQCSNDNNALPTGVDYCSADTTHPEWFLTDAGGQRLRYDGYPDHWQMDVGNAGYQQAWLAAVQPTLSAHGWDGVFLDNALTSADDYHHGVVPAVYPTNPTFQNAYRAMLGTVAGGLRAAGFVTVANINNARLYPGLWGSYLSYLDGAYEEWFVDWSATAGGSASDDDWKAQVDQIAETANVGKLALVRGGSTPADHDPEGFKYALGSYLLASDGRALFGFGFDLGYEPQYDWDLGPAANRYYAVGNGIYRRDFTAGTVIVNAGRASSGTVALGREYRDENGSPVTSVTVPAMRAVILRAPAAASPPPAPQLAPQSTARPAPSAPRTLRAAPPAPPTVTTSGPAEASQAPAATAEPATAAPAPAEQPQPQPQPQPGPSELARQRSPARGGPSTRRWILTAVLAAVAVPLLAAVGRRRRNRAAGGPR